MITKFGMSDKIGPVALGQSQGGMFLGRDMSSTRDFSEDTAATIDEEVSELVDVAYKRATKVLTDNRTCCSRSISRRNVSRERYEFYKRLL